MKSILIFLSALLLTSNTAFCQYTRFTKQGYIEFERTVNMFAILKPKNANSTWEQMYYDKYKSTQAQFVKLRSKLFFNEQKSLFKPVWKDNDKVKTGWGTSPATQINEVYTDFNTLSFTTLKKVFEEDFIVKDSLRNIKWKITDELREIAGYSCRRANAIIMDSIYVVAFYTDEIPVSGGPESFTGLPGMILGVALPHEHINWFATKVTDVPIPEKDFIIPNKGKPTNLKGLKEKILAAGDYFKDSLKSFLL